MATRTPKQIKPALIKNLDAKVFADLVASEERHRRLLELSHDLIVEVDKRGVIQHISPSAVQRLGYAPEAMVGQSVFDYVFVADRKRAETEFQNLLSGEESAHAVIRLIHSDGRKVWFDVVGQLAKNDKNEIIGAFAILRDVHEQHEAVKQLRKTNIELMAFKLAIQDAFNHIIICDSEAKILFANKGVERLTGYTTKEVLGKTPALWGKQMSQEFYQEFWDTIKNKRKPFHGEVINKRKNGTLYRAVMTVSPIINSEGNLVGFVGVEEDISSIKPPK